VPIGGAGNGGIDHYTVNMATVPRSAEAERHDHLLHELLGQVSAYNPKLDSDLIRKAFDYACDHHAGQLRKSGEPFIHHPWSVAQVCAGMKLDSATIAAALMHDVVEDTSAELEQVREEFGDEVALLVEGVTKLSKINFASREQAQAENYRKMIMAMAQDVRVVLIKLADRLHNMRTIEALPKQKQTAKARETLEIYAPLAHRLGIHSIKWEL
jgi:GTP diphosphokinase / guanosine-3',5'-bis(diphosphate) 3'-diphosphatase